jgi:C-terminal processing protease CtpA/Prc
MRAFFQPMRLLILLLVPLFFSCSVSKNYDPNKKYAREVLQKDYTLLRNVLEQKHPSLYWYTPKDSMDYFFHEGYKAIEDSMTELQFAWKILAPLTSAIHCGHTSVSMSKSWHKFLKDRYIPSFPFFVKAWNDTMMVTGSLIRKQDSTIKRGDFITSINGIKTGEIIKIMFDYMVEDGYADNVNYIRLSTGFPYFHRNIFGLYKSYFVTYSDSTGIEKSAIIPYFAPPTDSVKKIIKQRKINRRKLTYRERIKNVRSLELDSSYALMTINKFSKGHLNSFFRRSFRQLKKNKVQNLIIDLRANGGGDINKSVLLTKFLRSTSFKVADSAYSVSNTFRPFNERISMSFLNNIGLKFVTHKEKDGKYHFGFWEQHTFMPKRKNHFNGNVYVLINGLTFSASSLFCNAVKGQENITLAGEETGGGWYGNSGILIPDITLPNTKLKVRLPFFRLVQYEHIPIKGTGVIPDIYIGPDWRDVLNGVDTKLERVKKMIEAQK